MTLVRGPNVHLLVTDQAMVVLGSPGSVLPALMRLLEQHGRRRAPAEYQVGRTLLRVVPGRDGALVVGTPVDFAEAAA